MPLHLLYLFFALKTLKARGKTNIFNFLTFETSIFNLKVGERAQISETRVGENTVIANKTSLTKVVRSS